MGLEAAVIGAIIGLEASRVYQIPSNHGVMLLAHFAHSFASVVRLQSLPYSLDKYYCNIFC
jgi:hypothetical protein